MTDDPSSQVKASSANAKQQFPDFIFGGDPLRHPQKNQSFNGVVPISPFIPNPNLSFLPFPIPKEITNPSKRAIA
jgi:hypothetical protein